MFTGTNPAYKQYELTHHLRTSKANFIISEMDLASQIIKAAEELKIAESNLWIFNTDDEAISDSYRGWSELMQHGEKEWERFDDLSTSKSKTVALLFSSGTTGLPKAVEMTHYNLVAQHTLVHETVRKPYKVNSSLVTSNLLLGN